MVGLRRADRGAASVWVLVCSALVLLMGIAVSLRTSAVLARHRAGSAADLAALAAAGAIGLADDVCAQAVPIARANGGVLVGCHAALAGDGRSGTVDVRVSVAVELPGAGSSTATASARAGRLSTANPSTSAASDGLDGKAHLVEESGGPEQRFRFWLRCVWQHESRHDGGRSAPCGR